MRVERLEALGDGRLEGLSGGAGRCLGFGGEEVAEQTEEEETFVIESDGGRGFERRVSKSSGIIVNHVNRHSIVQGIVQKKAT